MEAPSTPPPSTSRYGGARTPPSPTYGALLEDWDPYSPRRSTRSTLVSNKYSTPNISRTIHNNVPPLNSNFSVKPAFTLNDVLSPPSSPMNIGAMTPRKADNHKTDNSNINESGDPSSSIRKTSSLFPTPAKTPSLTPARNHQRVASLQDTARVLHFQPEDPADAMPTRRESRKHDTTRAGKSQGFDLDVGDYTKTEQNSIANGFEIYTESHARVPEKDESEANPFYRPRAHTIPQTRDKPKRRSKKSAAMIAEEQRMDEAAARNEGIVYNFRGRKVFRRFEGVPPPESDDEEPGSSAYQLALKRAVGSAASRPMTRSSIKPRLLFQSFDSGYGASDDIDEEAETDVEMADVAEVAHMQETVEEVPVVATPAKTKSSTQPMMSPPTTKRASRKHDAEYLPATADDAVHLPTPARSGRKKKVEINDVPIYHDDTPEPVATDEGVSSEPALPTPARSSRKKKVETHLTPVIEETESPGGRDTSPAPAFPAGRRNVRSPFDDWPRTKAGHKRDGEPLEGASSGAAGKRTRNAARQ
ncbi:hypothetical protein M409DRAFT_66271 [Zasmidium cellare ATCC 36951]|uniref:Uncharacterized protein n=1 Tax=Zasmidium cellare ATCC 36951 TaxID=1080233 RepID=A0A6A6CM09_ZASCE|nr:uncharacterized protein M409DRAFT_66271 [Zasmidium cellare ATCC 36951]KAF2167258.1 hypothetical protein M409DRAFT_66271 [Zasmidium cellare ATCC 36951]